MAHLCYASYRSLSKFEYNGSKLNCNLLTSAITNMITFPNWFISAQQCEKWCWDYETLNRRSTFLCRHNSTRLAEVYDFFTHLDHFFFNYFQNLVVLGFLRVFTGRVPIFSWQVIVGQLFDAIFTQYFIMFIFEICFTLLFI